MEETTNISQLAESLVSDIWKKPSVVLMMVILFL